MSPSSSPSSSETVSSFSSDGILRRYDGFLVDQWGVMHNGMEAMNDAPDCLAALAQKWGKKLVILSNSPLSKEETLRALVDLGFDPLHFEGMLASAYIYKTYANERSCVWHGSIRRRHPWGPFWNDVGMLNWWIPSMTTPRY
jgi:hypothetical protein